MKTSSGLTCGKQSIIDEDLCAGFTIEKYQKYKEKYYCIRKVNCYFDVNDYVGTTNNCSYKIYF